MQALSANKEARQYEIWRCEVAQHTRHGLMDFMYRVAIDTVGPLKITKRSCRYVLIAIDHFSKWVEALPVVNHDAATSADFFET